MAIPFNRLAPLYEQHRNEYDEAALRVLASGWYVLGKELEAFEQTFASFIGTSYCVGLNSGLDALTLGLRAMGIGPGDEVIVQANTYIATVLAISENGATPVFVEPDSFYGIDPARIEEAITRRTKAIMAVHLYGQPCDMESLTALSQKHGIPLIEDCAQSHGASFRGCITGSFGSLGCFSFFPTKNLGAFGDAGAIVTDDKVLAEKLRMLRNYGSRKKYYNEVCGVNSRLDELQAALLQVRLKHLEEILQERTTIAEYYMNHITNDAIILPKTRPQARHVWHLFVIETESRDTLQHYLEQEGIQTQIHYPVPPHLSQAYAHLGFPEGSYPLTERIAKRTLSLPLYNGMTEGEMDQVCRTVDAFRV
ncbi:DegT/DnrJ/EryC1/StrS family aminotransferase [Aminithiophilus ramosus]|uniref:DegT/DnrJ/EryC1/StrS family aminotransferase n=1 Tax=Aminithiophilus ramosus TaxID=3029084 RepID=A0A9Q7AN19_9BACT|nr:DegT/DnrJ/EryC1/StrS family aminotransferase [Aminithiophilus ramosus]QTX31892.1 DegT/DnrJ/EryC1/StrS family aminotransferase [Aminithiophilus ramosus]